MKRTFTFILPLLLIATLSMLSTKAYTQTVRSANSIETPGLSINFYMVPVFILAFIFAFFIIKKDTRI